MRFNDSLTTVLATDTASRSGAEAAWRQLVDLIARRRVPDVDAAIARLAALRPHVAPGVRGATARALAGAEPPAALVAFFSEDHLAIAAPVLRTAVLSEAAWLDLLPRLSPAGRSVLRHRRDLAPAVVRGLESFGATDFVLAHDGAAEPDGAAPEVIPVPPPTAPAIPERPAFFAPEPGAEAPRFEIADLVARIDAFRRDQPAPVTEPSALPSGEFQFHTDPGAVIRWVEGVARGPLIGLCLTRGGAQGLAALADGVPGRAAFRGLALQVGGDSSAAGSWTLAGEPRFDRVTGQFAGFAGIGRRQAASPAPASAADTLRQLLHELRTPANAIGGFAELIGTELLGPVPPVYRDRALLIGREAGGLSAAIDDLDTAARLESGALALRADKVDLTPMVARAVADLAPEVQARGLTLTTQAPPWAEVAGDEGALRRLVERLLSAAVALGEPGERLHAQLVVKLRGVRLHVTRPRALSGDGEGALLETGPEAGKGALLLGAGFTLRLVRDLADAVGGSFTIGAERLTLRLPSPVAAKMEQAATR